MFIVRWNGLGSMQLDKIGAFASLEAISPIFILLSIDVSKYTDLQWCQS